MHFDGQINVNYEIPGQNEFYFHTILAIGHILSLELLDLANKNQIKREWKVKLKFITTFEVVDLQYH